MLEVLIKQSIAAYKAMSPAEREAMHQAQRRSWARAEIGFGSDADEARYRVADTDERKRLDAEANARVAAFDAKFEGAK